MEIKRFFKIASLIISLSAVVCLVFFLLTSWNYCIILFEPRLYIRIPEIILGIISIPFLIKMIYDLK
jgi:hypothetical protein